MEDKFEEKAKQWDSNPVAIDLSEKFFCEINKNIEIKKEFKLLDFGCGTGMVGLSFWGKVNSLVMVDNSKAMLSILYDKIQKQGLTNVDVFEGDIRKLAIQESSVDVIISSLTFHHVEDIASVLAAMRSLLKKNGTIIISDLCKEDGRFHGDEKVEHNGFDIEEMKKYFIDCRMCVEKAYVYNIIKKPDKTGKVNDYEQFILIARK